MVLESLVFEDQPFGASWDVPQSEGSKVGTVRYLSKRYFSLRMKKQG